MGEGSVEVAHEALLREWPRLREWIEEDAEGRRLRRHITRAATEWDTAGRDQGELYRGARLAAALDWSADHALELNELERDFVTESREASEQETGASVARTAASAGCSSASPSCSPPPSPAGSSPSSSAARPATRQTAQLAQRLGAQALAEEDLALSLLLASQAVAIDDSPQTRGDLLAALLRSPAAIGILHGHGEVLRATAISPDGQTVAVGAGDGGVLYFDAITHDQIGKPLRVAGGAESLAYSPDGRTLAVGGDHFVRLIDVRARRRLAETAVGGVATRVAFTNDGSRLVDLVAPGAERDLGQADAVITIRDAGTLKPVDPQ